MKKVWKEFISINLTQRERDLFTKNYPLAYQIASRFHAPQISDDVKETIALNALQHAVQKYDATKKAKFSTFLYWCITNCLKSETQRIKRQPIKVAEVFDAAGIYVSVFDRLVASEPKQPTQFLENLKSKLSARQNLILDMLIYPDLYLEKAIALNLKKVPKRMTYTLIANTIQRSVPRVATEIKAIRSVALKTFKELEND